MEIQLGGKKVITAIVSESDYKLVSKYKWCLNGTGYTNGNINGIQMLIIFNFYNR